MTHAHTPGPWLVEFELDDLDSSASDLRVIDGRSLDHPQGPLTIATINVAAHAPHLDEPLANAALIAAAPALHAALIKIVANAAESPEWIRMIAAPALAAAASCASHTGHQSTHQVMTEALQCVMDDAASLRVGSDLYTIEASTLKIVADALAAASVTSVMEAQ